MLTLVHILHTQLFLTNYTIWADRDCLHFRALLNLTHLQGNRLHLQLSL